IAFCPSIEFQCVPQAYPCWSETRINPNRLSEQGQSVLSRCRNVGAQESPRIQIKRISFAVNRARCLGGRKDELTPKAISNCLANRALDREDIIELPIEGVRPQPDAILGTQQGGVDTDLISLAANTPFDHIIAVEPPGRFANIA